MPRFNTLISCLLLSISLSPSASSASTYQLPQRQAPHRHRRNEETLTFSGDVDLILELANNKGLRKRAEDEAAANGNTIDVEGETVDTVQGVDEVPMPEEPPKGIDDGTNTNHDKPQTLCPTGVPLSSTPTNAPILLAATNSPASSPVQPTGNPETVIDAPEEIPSAPDGGGDNAPSHSAQENTGWFPVSSPTYMELTPPSSTSANGSDGNQLPAVTDEYKPTSSPGETPVDGGGTINGTDESTKPDGNETGESDATNDSGEPDGGGTTDGHNESGSTNGTDESENTDGDDNVEPLPTISGGNNSPAVSPSVQLPTVMSPLASPNTSPTTVGQNQPTMAGSLNENPTGNGGLLSPSPTNNESGENQSGGQPIAGGNVSLPPPDNGSSLSSSSKPTIMQDDLETKPSNGMNNDENDTLNPASGPSLALPSTPTVGGETSGSQPPSTSPNSPSASTSNTPTASGGSGENSPSSLSSPNIPTIAIGDDTETIPSNGVNNDENDASESSSSTSFNPASSPSLALPNTPTVGEETSESQPSSTFPNSSSASSSNTPTESGGSGENSPSALSFPNTPTIVIGDDTETIPSNGVNNDENDASESSSSTSLNPASSPSLVLSNTPTVGGENNGSQPSSTLPNSPSAAPSNTPTVSGGSGEKSPSSLSSPNAPATEQGNNASSSSQYPTSSSVGTNTESSPSMLSLAPTSPTVNGNAPTDDNADSPSSPDSPTTTENGGLSSSLSPSFSPNIPVLGGSGGSSPSPSSNESGPAQSPTLISCSESSLDRPGTVDFTYSIETESAYFQERDQIRRATEEALTKDIANLLLPCGIQTRRLRQLQSGNSLGFEGVDHLPEDSFSPSALCDPYVFDNDCSIVDGILTVYIEENADFELAKYYTLTAIREALSLVDAQVTGLVKATYLGPDIVNPAAFNPNSAETEKNIEESDDLSTSLVLFAVGGCAFVASVGLIYYLRRQGNGQSGAATAAAGSDQQTGLSREHSHPLSPFSEMLPSAYRFDQDGQMSAILELDDESATQRSGIAISESGFTTDEEGSSCAISSMGDTDPAGSVNRSSVLGARKRDEQDESMDSLLELL